MCFFDQHRFACGDWKWGHFRQHCAKEYRIGQTCGMKLIMQTVPVAQKCKICEKIDTKMRRRAAEVDRVHKWQGEGLKFRASIDKSMETIRTLDSEIYELSCERNRRLQGIGALSAHGSTDEENSTYRQKSMTQYQMVKKKDVSFTLPLTFENVQNPATVMAIPDTGADLNVISLDLAKVLGFEMEDLKAQTLDLANGNKMQCRAIIRATFRFAKSAASRLESLKCTLHIVQNLASPLIMCQDFLNQTWTMTLHPERLVTSARSAFRIPRLMALGNIQERLLCSIDGTNVEALADTGSDVDVVSLRYAVERGFRVEQKESWLMFADGTVSRSYGIIRAQLAAGFGARKLADAAPPSIKTCDSNDAKKARASKARSSVASMCSTDQDSATRTARKKPLVQTSRIRKVIQTQFFVMDVMRYDVIVGNGSLAALDVYTRHPDCLVARETQVDEAAQLNRIILLPGLDRKFRKIARAWLARAGSSNARPTVPIDHILTEADQKENARTESARLKISQLEGEARAEAEAKEEVRQKEFENYRALIVRAVQSTKTDA